MPYTYRSLCELLCKNGIDEAKYEAALLLGHFCGAERATLIADKERVWNGEGLERAVSRRIEHYPLQYIIGEWEFFGCKFLVDENCLIPRPDTEVLVESVLSSLPTGAVVADLCTGSGCIAISLLKERKDIRVIALELYEKTLELALHNAELNQVADRFIPCCADLLCGGEKILSDTMRFCGANKLDAIVSNPPYIPTAEVDGLAPELFYEPRAALDGGEDGLTFYRAIVENYSTLLKENGKLFFEIGSNEADDVENIAKSRLPKCSCTVVRDLGGNDRVLKILLIGGT